MRLLATLALSLLPLLGLGCAASNGSEGGDPNRGPIAKADKVGSCDGADGPVCDGKAPEGNCYCDATCTMYGDCCEDRAALCGGGGGGGGTGSVPEFGADASRKLVQIADGADGLDVPRDVEFNPEAPDQLWTVNRAFDGTVIVFDPGTPDQRVEVRQDAFAEHFMEEVSSFAFGDASTFATGHESRNTYNNAAFPNDFMGITLWPSDLQIYARVNQDRNGDLSGSHLDMLHQSPFSMGIAHHAKNQYWVFDGMHGHIVFYDFQKDHGPGYHDHSDGIVRRYIEAQVKRVPNVPSHLHLDKESGWLYVADTGNKRVLRLDVESGNVDGYYQSTNEPLVEYSRVQGVTVEVFASAGLDAPSGIEFHDGRLFVSDFGTGDIVAFDANGQELGRLATGARGIMGLTVGPDGKLYFVDGVDNLLVRVDP